MRKHTSRAQQPGVCPDGLPNRAMRRQNPAMAGAVAINAFRGWYLVASNLIPGYVPLDETDTSAEPKEQDARQAA